MPQIGIIVPVYNVKPLLTQCIDSLLNQTLEDIEIILIDDGSTDGSDIICDKYAEKDNRIKVIHKQNEGLSAARNEGISLSNAPYIMFVDSDDWVEPLFCELPYVAATKYSADIVLFTYQRVYRNGRILPISIKEFNGLLSEEQAFYFCLYILDAAWIGLYRRELFSNVKYPVWKYYEDVGTTHRLIHTAEKIFLLNKVLYNYRADRVGSITTDPITKAHPDRKEMHLRRIQDLRNWGYEDLIRKKAFEMLITYGTRDADMKYLIELVRGKEIEDMSTKLRLMLGTLKASPQLFDLICKVARKLIVQDFYYSIQKN